MTHGMLLSETHSHAKVLKESSEKEKTHTTLQVASHKGSYMDSRGEVGWGAVFNDFLVTCGSTSFTLTPES